MKKIAAVVLAFALSGCFHFHYVTGEKPAPGPMSETWHNGFLWGLAEGAPVDLSGVCPSGPFAQVDSTESFINGVVHAVTWSIYTPETIVVTCTAADAAQVPESPTRPWAK